MLFLRGKGKISFFLILGITKQVSYPKAAPRRISATFVVSCTKNYWTQTFFFCMLQQSKNSFRVRVVHVVQTFCLKQTFGLFMPKWTLACVWHAEMNFGKPKRITEIRSGCVGHLHPQGDNRLEKPKMNTKGNPSMNEKDGMESNLRTKAPKGERARVQLRSK